MLGIAGLGADDDFFDLGGHSLQAIQVIAEVRQALGVQLGLRALLEASTIAGLAAAVEGERHGGEAIPPLVARPLRPGERIPLTLSQEQMWRLETTADPPGLFNVTAQHWFWGSVDARHDTLRTSFGADGGEPRQSVDPAVDVDLAVCDLRTVPEAERDAELHRRVGEQDAAAFDLTRAPLFRACLYRVDRAQHGGHHLRSPRLRRDLGVRLSQRARRRLRGPRRGRGTGASSPRRAVPALRPVAARVAHRGARGPARVLEGKAGGDGAGPRAALDIPFARVRQAVLPHFPSGGLDLLAAVPVEFQYFHTTHDEWAPGTAVVERPGPDKGPGELFSAGSSTPST